MSSEKSPTTLTPSNTRSSIEMNRMEEEYDDASESIGVRSITTKKQELKISEPEPFDGYPRNFRRFK